MLTSLKAQSILPFLDPKDVYGIKALDHLTKDEVKFIDEQMNKSLRSMRFFDVVQAIAEGKQIKKAKLKEYKKYFSSRCHVKTVHDYFFH